MKSLKISKKEAAKLTHEINNVWHIKYRGKHIGVIESHSNGMNDPSYEYFFINYGFNNHQFIGKYPTKDRR